MFRMLGFGAVLVTTALSGTMALAADKCVRVVGAEWSSEKITPDPADQTNVANMQLSRMIYNPLIDLDVDLKPVPVLAEAWESNADGTQWTFHIRKDVHFHDGSPLTAKDVVYTYQRLIDPQTKSPAAANLSGLTKDSFVAVDEHTMLVKPSGPQVELPTVLATNFALIVKDGATSEQIRSDPNGTGPFKLPEFLPGKPNYELSKNPSYWQPGLPKADCIELSAIAEPVARLAAILAGQADLATVVDPSTVLAAKDNPNISLSSSKGGTSITMGMFVDVPPFNDMRVRQALKLVIDRPEMVKTALLGFGFAGNDNPVPPNSPDAFRSDVMPRDVGKAKALLAEAGYPNGIDVELYISDVFPGTMAMGQTYQQMAADAGIRVKLNVVPAGEYWDNIWLKKPFAVSNWGARPTTSALSVAYRKSSTWNETHWVRDDYEALLDKAASTVDETARRDLYQKAQKLLSEEGGVIVPIFSSSVSALRGECSGYETPSDHNRPIFAMLRCD